MLVLDAGNALFKNMAAGSFPMEKERAAFLLAEMDALGTTAMAVGAKDLPHGADFLRQAMKGRKMKLLSANLVDAAGSPLFAASTVVTVGKVKFGVVGVSPEGPQASRKDVVGRPAIPAALAEARRLRQKDKVDVVVLLAALPYMEADTLAQKAGDAVDFVLQSNNGQLSRVVQRSDFASLVTSGERGRQVMKLALSVDGPGLFVDLHQGDQAERNLALVEQNLKRARAQLASTSDPLLQKTWRDNIAHFEESQKRLLRQKEETRGGARRTQALSILELGPQVPSDAEVKQRVERIEPAGGASH